MNTDRDSVLNMDDGRGRRSLIILPMLVLLMLYMYQRVNLTDTNWSFQKQQAYLLFYEKIA